MSAAAKGAVGAKGTAGARGAAKGSNASGPPVGRPNLPKFEEKDLLSWHDSRFQGKLDDLKVLGDEVIALQVRRKELDEEIKEKTVVARALMEDVSDLKSWSVRDEAWTGSYVKPEDRETLVKEKLIEQGVTWKQIEKATKKTPVTPYVMFRPRKEI